MNDARSWTPVLYGLMIAGFFAAGFVSAALLRFSAMVHPAVLVALPMLTAPLMAPATVFTVRWGRAAAGAGLAVCAVLGALIFALVALLVLAGQQGLDGAVRGLRQGAAELLMTGAPVAAGTLLGVALLRGWTYARSYAAGAALLVGAAVVYGLANQPEWRAGVQSYIGLSIGAVTQEIERLEPHADDESYRQQLNLLKWYRDNHPYVTLGMLATLMLVETAVLTSLGAWWARRPGGGAPGLQGGFGHLRPPEWLVWAAIALAVLWFLDRRWSEPWLRAVVWNGALGLSGVYFLNGLSVCVFAARLFRPNLLLLVALLLLVFVVGLHPAMAALGLFDTWADFRARLVRAVEQARRRSEDDGEE